MASSNQTSTSCLSEAQLGHYHARELPEREATAVREHLAQCDTCATQAAELLAIHNSWVDRFQAVKVAVQDVVHGPAPEGARIPHEIAGYEILGEIRRGGQGIVFRALQKGTKREVALKVLREGRYASDATRKRFEREVELVAALRHPHIVTVFDSGETPDGHLYFAMDYIRGERLDGFTRAHSESLPELLRLFGKVGQAVNYAHQRGVIHRDLKPSNILVDETGEPRILDFGLARPVEQGDLTVMTTTGQVAGTLPYMSPEQARGLPDAVDVRSDVYALGVILYELLTGTYPYPVDSDMLKTLRHIAETPPERPSRVRRRALHRPAGSADSPLHTAAPLVVDDELEAIVLKALAKEQDERYQTAGELARDIDRYLAGEPVAAKRDAALANWYVVRKTLYRHRLAAGVALAFALVVLAALIVSVTYWHDAVAQRDAARAAEAQARERFEQVRELARYFVINFDPLIEHLPGAAPARLKIVEMGRRYLDVLAADADDNIGLQLEIAAAHMTIGDIQGDLHGSNLGELTAAMESYRTAQEVLGRAAAAEPDRPQTESLRVLNLLKVADLQCVLGNLEGALVNYRDALARGLAAFARHPDAHYVRDHCVSAHERIGNMLRNQGKLDEAIEHYDEAASLSRESPVDGVENLVTLRSRFTIHARKGRIAYSRGQLNEALEHYRTFRAKAQEFLSVDAANIVLRRDVGVAHQWIGIILADLGQPTPAVESLRRSVAMDEGLLRDDPQDDTARTALATTYIKMGEAQLAAGLRTDAEASFQESLELTRQVAERQPERAGVHRLLGVSYYKMAEFDFAYANDEATPLAERAARQQAACNWLQRCLDTFVSMRERGILAPADAGVPDDLALEIEQCQAALRDLMAGNHASEHDEE